MKIMKKVSCVIITYNGMKWIENCLRSLERSDYPVDVIVIDNGSNDGTIELIDSSFKNVNFVKSPKNLGFGAANNLGFEMAASNHSEFVFLLNQDTIIYPDTVGRLIDVFTSKKTIGIVSPLHLNDNGDKLDKKFEEYISAKTCQDFISDMTLGNPKAYYEIGFVNAAAWMVKAAAVTESGLFAKECFHYGEDSNFLQRLKYHGFSLVITPFSKIHHLREERKGQLTEKFRKEQTLLAIKSIMLNLNFSSGRKRTLMLKFLLSKVKTLKIRDFFLILYHYLYLSRKYSQIKNRYKMKNQNINFY